MTCPYRLEAIHLQGVGVFDNTLIRFKPIESAEQDEKLAEIHLFTGSNGCGKSTILYTMAEIFKDIDSFITSMLSSRLKDLYSCIDFKFLGEAGSWRQLKQQAYLKVTSGSIIDNNVFGEFKIFTGDKPRYFFGYGSSGLFEPVSNSKLYKYKYKSTRYYQFAAFAYSGYRIVSSNTLNAIQAIQSSPFEDALSFDNTVKSDVIIQWIANNRTQMALAKADNDLKAVKTYDLALNRIVGLIKDVCDMDVEFKLQRSPLAVKMKVNGDVIGFDGLPDGLKSIISWVADLSLRLEAIPWEVEQDIFSQPIILFLDEVDIHLHPKWQRKILPAIQKLLPNSQIFATTHSPFVVGSVEHAWVYRLPELDGKTDGITEIEGVPSGAGKSYQLILNEIFGVDKEFDVETEALFDDFYSARAVFLKNQTNKDQVIHLARQLAERGEEIVAIVSRELRQMSRIAGIEVSLA